MINKSSGDKVFIWNPSNWECECVKSCDVREFLGCENCKCRKKIVDKLVEECIENIDGVKLAKITQAEHENMCECSRKADVVLFSVLFNNNGTATFFVNYKYMNHDKKQLLEKIICFKHEVTELINGKYQTSKR